MTARLPRLIAITDLGVLGSQQLVARLAELTGRAVPGSVAVLLRDHAASARQRLVLGQELRALTRQFGQQLWVADRLDLALLLQADAVHLGEASARARDARRLLGSALRVSRAWHEATVDASSALELDGVDALLVSPIFAARKGRAALGISALVSLAHACQAHAPAPALYALGGVTAAEVPACDAAGASGVAAIGAALSGDPGVLLSALQIRR